MCRRIARIGSWLRGLLFLTKRATRPPFRSSRYIDFNTGKVITAPMDLKKSMPATMTTDQKIDGCRVDVWQFGVASAILKQIEAAQHPSIWLHAAYGLVSVVFTYFEMIGKTLNPNSKASGSASDDFNYGFCNVYPQFTPAKGDTPTRSISRPPRQMDLEF